MVTPLKNLIECNACKRERVRGRVMYTDALNLIKFDCPYLIIFSLSCETFPNLFNSPVGNGFTDGKVISMIVEMQEKYSLR